MTSTTPCEEKTSETAHLTNNVQNSVNRHQDRTGASIIKTDGTRIKKDFLEIERDRKQGNEPTSTCNCINTYCFKDLHIAILHPTVPTGAIFAIWMDSSGTIHAQMLHTPAIMAEIARETLFGYVHTHYLPRSPHIVGIVSNVIT